MHKEIKHNIDAVHHGTIPVGYKNTKWGVRPDNWKRYYIKDIFKKVGEPVKVELEKEYIQIGIRSHGRGVFVKEPVTGLELGNKAVFWIEPDCFVVNIVFAWEQAIAKTTQNEIGLIGSHRFPMYRPISDVVNLDYILYLFMTKRGKTVLEDASPGGAGRNKTLGQDRFFKSSLILPSIKEQERIAEIISHFDKLIEMKQKLIEEEQRKKKWLAKKMITGEFRLPRFKDNWRTYELGEVFEYVQPGPYLVKSTDYNDEYNTPVLTAGKTFVLGYTNETDGIYSELPVVIFDDFTTSSKFVEFPFKAKSSAMKILKIKKGFDIKFAFESLQQVRYTVAGHERHWISKYSSITIDIACIEEQKEIANILSASTNKIYLLEQEITQWQQKKKALMQLLLTGIVRVSV